MKASIATAACGGQLWIKVSGPAGMNLAPQLLASLEQRPHQTCCEVWIDLAECTSLDSTFAGTLVGLVQKAARGRLPTLHLNNPSERCRKNLQQMHLQQLFVIDSGPLPAEADWQVAQMDDAEHPDMTGVVVRAHEDLAAADPRNEEFRRIAEAFAEDQRRHGILPTNG